MPVPQLSQANGSNGSNGPHGQSLRERSHRQATSSDVKRRQARLQWHQCQFHRPVERGEKKGENHSLHPIPLQAPAAPTFTEEGELIRVAFQFCMRCLQSGKNIKNPNTLSNQRPSTIYWPFLTCSNSPADQQIPPKIHPLQRPIPTVCLLNIHQYPIISHISLDINRRSRKPTWNA